MRLCSFLRTVFADPKIIFGLFNIYPFFKLLEINLFMKSQLTINLTCDFQDIVLYLLENGADIDMFNNHNNTPFFLATESLQKEICQVAKNIQQLYYQIKLPMSQQPTKQVSCFDSTPSFGEKIQNQAFFIQL